MSWRDSINRIKSSRMVFPTVFANLHCSFMNSNKVLRRGFTSIRGKRPPWSTPWRYAITFRKWTGIECITGSIDKMRSNASDLLQVYRILCLNSSRVLTFGGTIYWLKKRLLLKTVIDCNCIFSFLQDDIVCHVSIINRGIYKMVHILQTPFSIALYWQKTFVIGFDCD